MPETQLIEYRLKPMFTDDFRLSWRTLHGTLKKLGVIDHAELYNVEPSRFISIVEWKIDPSVVMNEEQFRTAFEEINDLADRIQTLSPLTRLESTQ